MVNSDAPFAQDVGGHVHVVSTARRLEGFELVFFGPKSSEARLREEVPGCSYVAMPDFPALPWRANLMLRAIFGISRRRELRRADAILATSHFVADVVPAVAARPSRTVVVLHHFIGRPGERPGNPIANAVAWLSQELALLFVRAYAARFVFVSSFVARQGEELVAGRPSFLVPNAAAAPPGFAPRPFEAREGALYLGRLVAHKRVEDAIGAWARVAPEHRRGGLTIVGAGPEPYPSSLREAARAGGIDAEVAFCGRVDDAEKWRRLGAASIFVFPSAEEGWGISIAEAMAAGLPCVTYDLPVFADIFVKGRIAVPLGDVDALAAACESLLSDDALRARLSREAFELAQTFSWEASAAAMAAALTFDSPAEALREAAGTPTRSAPTAP